MPIDHTSTAALAAAYMRAKRVHVGARRARLPLEVVERLALELLEQLVEAVGVLAHELAVDAAVGEQHLQHAVDERDVAAGVHRRRTRRSIFVPNIALSTFDGTQ